MRRSTCRMQKWCHIIYLSETSVIVPILWHWLWENRKLEPLNFGVRAVVHAPKPDRAVVHAPKPDHLDTGKTEVHTADSSVALLGNQAWYNIF